jgi:rod shape determining protein RodA
MSSSYSSPTALRGRPPVRDYSGRPKESIWARIDWVLMAAVLGLCALGAVLVWSATRQRLLDVGGDPEAFLKKHLLNLTIGLVLGTVTMLLDYRLLRAYAPIIYVVSLLGLVAVLSPLGSTINGANAWIKLPAGFSVQPSEFVKVAIVLGMLQPDLGTAMVICAMIIGMLAVAGVNAKWLLGMVGSALLFAAVAVKVGVLSQYQIDRFAAFANPALDPRGVGYNTSQARIAIGSGGLTGTGLFEGTQTSGKFVPEQQTDFVFTVAGEELGLLGAGLVIVICSAFSWRPASRAGSPSRPSRISG